MPIEPPLTAQDVRDQVERICASDIFNGQGNSKRILRHLAEAAINGQRATEASLAADLWNRELVPGDAIVRTPVHNLCEQLRRYYADYLKSNGYSPSTHIIVNNYQLHASYDRNDINQAVNKSVFNNTLKATPKDARNTALKFWPSLADSFPQLCITTLLEDGCKVKSFDSIIDGAALIFCDEVALFFDAIQAATLYIGFSSYDPEAGGSHEWSHCIDIYPPVVWLANRSQKNIPPTMSWRKDECHPPRFMVPIINSNTITLPPALIARLPGLPPSNKEPVEIGFWPDGSLQAKISRWLEFCLITK